jgi:hypothetical protein
LGQRFTGLLSFGFCAKPLAARPHAKFGFPGFSMPLAAHCFSGELVLGLGRALGSTTSPIRCDRKKRRLYDELGETSLQVGFELDKART